MATVKFTKQELKAQQANLARYRRFLPTLTLKKQQLQMEVRELNQLVDELEQDEIAYRERITPWVDLFAEQIDIARYIQPVRTTYETGNIMGTTVRFLREIEFPVESPDPESTPPWLDEGVEVLRALVRLALEKRALKEQREVLGIELRATTQRVNLFEKIKIPETQENIRRIRIFLGDQETAAIVRAKIAKGKRREAGA
jgi:V/A-type H+-transporting ATPase subunit D